MTPHLRSVGRVLNCDTVCQYDMANPLSPRPLKRNVFIPCPSQAGQSISMLFGRVPITTRVCPHDPGHCTLTLPPQFTLKDPDTGGAGPGVRLGLGSSVVFQYAGQECEVRVGRRITVTDAL